MKRTLSVLAGVLLGSVIGMFAQTLSVTNIPAYQQAVKYVTLNLVANDRFLCVTNPVQAPGGTVLVDQTIPIGKSFTGEMQVRGTMQ